MEPNPAPQSPRNKHIYLLPNLLTTCGMFAGFYAILAAASGRFEAAAVAIFIAAVFDGIDGRVARLTGTSSEFGVQYDSLADLVSFGMAPALVMYHWSLSAMKLDGLTAGKLADYVVLAEDPTVVKPERIKDIPISETVVDGRSQYRA